MKVKNLMQSDGRIFLKSEWGPINDGWPCVSFQKPSVGKYLRANFQRGRDVLIYVGTTNSDFTKNPDHLRRLLSAVVIEPKQVLATKKIISPKMWERNVQEQGKERWLHSMAAITAARLTANPLPDAHDVIPESYRQLGSLKNWGGVVPVLETERQAVMDLDIEQFNLNYSDSVRNYLEISDAISVSKKLDPRIIKEINRMAQAIFNRVNNSGREVASTSPVRIVSNESDVYLFLGRKWEIQDGKCALCGGRLAYEEQEERNRLLQPSADRIDSDNNAYSEENVQITHLACNLAKNKYSDVEFEEWLDVVRGGD